MGDLRGRLRAGAYCIGVFDPATAVADVCVGGTWDGNFSIRRIRYGSTSESDGCLIRDLSLVRQGETPGKATKTVCLRMAVVVACAGLLSAHVLHTLVTTQIKGVAGTAQDQKTKDDQWNFATQWSFPKAETLRLFIPGIYGYRLDTPNGGNYWGSVGRSAGWDQTKQGIPRHSGSGEYAGLLVVMLAGFAFIYSWRRGEDVYTREQKRNIWFWSAAGFICLLLSYGKYAPLFQFFYWLPYMSTIRSPLKFLHIVHLALVILFAFGLHGLFKIGIAAAKDKGESFGRHLGKWWKEVAAFDRRWMVGLSSFSSFPYSAQCCSRLRREF